MPRAADGKGACSDLRRRTTTMIGIGIVFSVVGLGYLCWALFDLIVYALPAVVGVSAGFAAYHRRPDRRRLHPGGGAGRTRDIPIAEDPHGHRIPLRRAGRLGGLYADARNGATRCPFAGVATGICAVRIHGRRRHGLGAHDAAKPARATWRTMTWL
jgi:hypothetical protein